MRATVLCSSIIMLAALGCGGVAGQVEAEHRLQDPRPDDVRLRVIDWHANRELRFYTFKYNPGEPNRPCHYLAEALVPIAKVVDFANAGDCGLGEGTMTDVRLRRDWDK